MIAISSPKNSEAITKIKEDCKRVFLQQANRITVLDDKGKEVDNKLSESQETILAIRKNLSTAQTLLAKQAKEIEDLHIKLDTLSTSQPRILSSRLWDYADTEWNRRFAYVALFTLAAVLLTLGIAGILYLINIGIHKL